MNYLEYIESTKTWTCPKSGPWKIIAVGGGAGGGFITKGGKVVQPTGGSTSFGNLLTAKGGQQGKLFVYDPEMGEYAKTLGFSSENSISEFISTAMKNWHFFELKNAPNVQISASGQYGFDGVNYGEAGTLVYNLYGNLVKNLLFDGHSHGAKGTFTQPAYGSGGGFSTMSFTEYRAEGSSGVTSATWQSKRYVLGGLAGQMKVLVADLVQNQQYQCTIGKGGDVTTEITAAKVKQIDSTEAEILTAKPTSTGQTFLALYDITAEHNGRDGVIILQYMGV